MVVLAVRVVYCYRGASQWLHDVIFLYCSMSICFCEAVSSCVALHNSTYYEDIQIFICVLRGNVPIKKTTQGGKKKQGVSLIAVSESHTESDVLLAIWRD